MPLKYTICFRRIEGCERFHCAFPSAEYCGNTKEKGRTMMSDHKGFSTVLTMILLVSILLLLIPLCSSPAGMGVSAQSTQLTTVRFDVVAFDLPGPGWQQTTATPRQIGHTHKMGDGKSQSIAFWPVTFPPSFQGRSQQEHTSAYFDIERQKPRYEGRWEGFVEGAREIAGRQFPTMSFTVTFAAQRVVADGLFVLYFPDDFDRRGKFFALMWMDGHPQDQPGAGLDALEGAPGRERRAAALA